MMMMRKKKIDIKFVKSTFDFILLKTSYTQQGCLLYKYLMDGLLLLFSLDWTLKLSWNYIFFE